MHVQLVQQTAHILSTGPALSRMPRLPPGKLLLHRLKQVLSCIIHYFELVESDSLAERLAVLRVGGEVHALLWHTRASPPWHRLAYHGTSWAGLVGILQFGRLRFALELGSDGTPAHRAHLVYVSPQVKVALRYPMLQMERGECLVDGMLNLKILLLCHVGRSSKHKGRDSKNPQWGLPTEEVVPVKVIFLPVGPMVAHRADDPVEPTKIHTVVISTLHAEPQKATHGKKAEDCTGDDETAPSMEDVHRKEAQNIVHEHDIKTYPEHAHRYVLELERNGIREVFDFPLERSLYLDKKMGRRCQRQLLHIDDADL